MSWPEVALEDLIADVRPGFASGSDISDGILQVRMHNLSRAGALDFTKQRRVPIDRRTERFMLRTGDVLFNATNSPDLVGKTALFCEIGEPAVFSNHFLRLRVNPQRLDPGYLTRWMQWQHALGVFRAISQQWVNQAAVRTERLLRLLIPVPPLEDQRRVSRVLDAADAIRRKRVDAIATLGVLAEAVFAEMFASGQDDHWPTVPVRDLVDPRGAGIRTGPFGSQLLHSEFVDDGIAVLGIDNAVTNEFRWAKPRHITEAKYAALKRYTVHPRDILITIMGTCGWAAVVPVDIPPAINTKHL